MAWHVTGDDRYANKVLQIVDAHASTNKEWGLRHENGPLVSSNGSCSGSSTPNIASTLDSPK